MLVNRHRQQARAVIDEDIGCASVAWIFHSHASTRFEKHASKQIQTLLNAIGNHNSIGSGGNPPRCSHMQRNRFTQRQQALWVAIFAQAARILTQHALQQRLP